MPLHTELLRKSQQVLFTVQLYGPVTKLRAFLFCSEHRPTEKENEDNNFVDKNQDKHNSGCWVRACMSP